MTQRMLITGGTGLLGRALVRALLERGHQVTVFTRDPQKRRALFSSQVTLAPWRLDPEALRPWLEQADAVVHLVGASIGEGRWTARRKAEIYESRVKAGQVLVQAWEEAQNRPKVLLQASAVGYYGDQGDRVLTETAPPGEDFLARLCVDWEASTRPVELLGSRRVILRTGIVLSTQGGALPRLLLPIRLGVGGPLGSGQFYMPWIHIHDHIRAMLFFLEKESTQGPYNVCAPQPVTNEVLVRTLGRILRRPTWFRVPEWALRLLLGEMVDGLLASIRAVPQRLQEAGFTFQFPDLEPALRDLLITRR